MRRQAIQVALGSMLVIFLHALQGNGQAGGGLLLKTNLDLPFNAAGTSEDEEQAPEVIFLYGGMYEADAVVFCMDESKSMRKNLRWELQVREVTRAIMNLSDKTEFGMVFYGANAYWFRGSLLSADVGAKSGAVGFLNSRQLTLGTCTGPGVIKGLQLLDKAHNNYRTLIVTGDGRPTHCPFRGGGLSDAEVQTLLQQTVQANPGLKTKIHTIYTGSDTSPRATDFMKRLAAMHRGTYRAVTR